MPTPTAHPVQILRDHTTNFEAALAVCLAAPKVRPVHKLRTESRRLEAQIALLEGIRDLPPFRTEAKKALWQIKKLRQAAGRVRDLDVQTDHLKKHASKIRAESLSTSEKTLELADLEHMLTKRAEQRVDLAEDLVKEIQTRQTKVAAALEKLNTALKDAKGRSLASDELLGMAERRFARTKALKLRKPSADDLHTVRKAAKQARYLAENAGAKTAVETAKRYEHLQELGGAWHDWLDLSVAARKELGKKHKVSSDFRGLRDGNLERFRVELQKFVQPKAATTKKSRSAKKAKKASPAKK